MTPDEATEGAAERHELRGFNGYRNLEFAKCWCGWESPEFPTETQARNAHQRHQLNASLDRAYNRGRHL